MATPRTEAPGRSALLIFLSESLILPAGLIIAGLVSRALSPEGYGRYALTVAIVSGAQWIIVSYNGRATQMLSDHRLRNSYLPTIFQQYLGVSVVLMLLLMLLAKPFALLFQTPELVTYLPLLALDLPFFSLCQAQRCSIVAAGDYSGRAIAPAARWTARTLATWLLLSEGWGVEGAIAGWIFASFVEVFAVGRIDWRAMLRRGAPHLDVWREGRTMLLFTGGMRLFERLDLFLLQLFKADSRLTGIFSAAQVLTIIPSIFASSLGPVLNAVVIRRHTENLSADQRLAPALQQTGLRGMRAAISLLPLAFIFGVNGTGLATFAFGREFAAAGALLGALSVAALGVAIDGIAVGLLGAIGLHRLSWRFSLPTCALTLGAHCLVIPHFGAPGAAMVSAVMGMGTGLAAVAFVSRHLEQPFPMACLFRSIAAGVVAAALNYWPPFEHLWLPLRLALACSAALSVLIASGEWKVAEVRQMLLRRPA